MKSYFLEDVRCGREAAVRALRKMLPGQEEPWLMIEREGDPIAYFNICASDEAFSIQVDVSGRHFDQDAQIIIALRRMQEILGGTVRDDLENEL